MLFLFTLYSAKTRPGGNRKCSLCAIFYPLGLLGGFNLAKYKGGTCAMDSGPSSSLLIHNRIPVTVPRVRRWPALPHVLHTFISRPSSLPGWLYLSMLI